MKTGESSPAPGWLDVEAAVEAFERAYAADGAADPAAFCPPPGDPLHLPVAGELVRVALEFAARGGRPRRLADYRAAFPALFDDPAALAGVAFEEYRLRRQAGDRVTPGDYRTEYGIDTAGWPAGSGVVPANAPGRLGLTHLLAVTPQAGDLALEAGRFPDPGAEVSGFRLVRELGRGAFARVYLAEQIGLAGRLVALKLSTRFVTEAQMLARLQHTNIVPVFSIHRAGRFHVVCMPYLGATTLADVSGRLRDGGYVPATAEGLVSTLTDRLADSAVPGPPATVTPPLPVPAPLPAFTGPLDALRARTHVAAVLWIGAELADGLAHAHERGIIHRDLKPANVLLSDEGRPMLLDFNLAGDARRADAGGLVGGTPTYMPPEQLAAVAGEATLADARADLYSLGLIVYELLTGRPPHPVPAGRFEEQLARLRALRSAPPPPARTHNPAVTPAVDAILARCLAPAADGRYPSARHLAEDIRRHLDHLPLRHTPEPSVRERLRKKLRRNPWVKSVPVLVGLVAVVVAVGVGGYVYRTRQLERAEAGNTLSAFRRDADRVGVRLVEPLPDGRELTAALTAAHAALGRYPLPGPDGAAGWEQSAAVRHLTPDERAGLRGDLGELAFLTAGYEHLRADRSASPEDRRTALDAALRLNAAAAVWLAGDEGRLAVVAEQRSQLSAAGRPPSELSAAGDRPAALRMELAGLTARGEYRRALGLLRRGEPAHRGTTWYWRTRGLYHAAAGEWDAAAAAYTTALAVLPRDDADLRGRRGLAHLSAGRLAAAADDYDAALRLNPDDPQLLRDRAQVRLGRGDFKGAIADLDRAEPLDPGHTRVYFMRARVHTRAGDRAAAAREQAEGLKRTPGDELSWIARGQARRFKEPAAVVADLDEALKLNPTSRNALQTKASVLAEELGRPADAVAVLDTLLATHPEYVNARAGRGVVLARLGKRDAAHADAVAALTTDPAPFTRYQAAGIYALTSKTHPEDRAEALRLLASALRDKEGLSYIPTDHDLDPVRADPAFKRLVEAAKTVEEAGSSRPGKK